MTCTEGTIRVCCPGCGGYRGKFAVGVDHQEFYCSKCRTHIRLEFRKTRPTERATAVLTLPIRE